VWLLVKCFQYVLFYHAMNKHLVFVILMHVSSETLFNTLNIEYANMNGVFIGKSFRTLGMKTQTNN
jgi:hypothetical protein